MQQVSEGFKESREEFEVVGARIWRARFEGGIWRLEVGNGGWKHISEVWRRVLKIEGGLKEFLRGILRSWSRVWEGFPLSARIVSSACP